MGLSEIKKLIDELIQLERESNDINIKVLFKWLCRTATTNFNGFHLNCPCIFTTDENLHKCCDSCGHCKYNQAFNKIKMYFTTLTDYDKIKTAEYLSKQLDTLYRDLDMELKIKWV